jgi:hypothetical protein
MHAHRALESTADVRWTGKSKLLRSAQAARFDDQCGAGMSGARAPNILKTALRDNRWSPIRACRTVRREDRTVSNRQDAEERQQREQCSAGLHGRSAYTCGAFILILVVWRSSACLASLGDFTLTMPASGDPCCGRRATGSLDLTTCERRGLRACATIRPTGSRPARCPRCER